MTAPSTTASIAATTASSGLRISPSVADWFLSRGISQETLERVPVAAGTTFFPELKGKSEAAFFKFAEGWKARAVPDKAFVSSKGWKPTFWNLEPVLAYLEKAASGTVFVTEGEIDALSLVEAGLPEYQILSVPNGAGGGSTDPDRGMPWVLDGLDAGLARAKKIIWCGDMDEAGLALRSAMAHQFGIAKFWYVDWPEGCKDANEVLLKYDPVYLRNTVLQQAKAWPAEGLFRMAELPEPPKLTLWEPEIDCLKDRMWLAPTTLSVVTGQPGHGKSEFFGQLWFEVAQKYNVPICMASFETRPKPYVRRQVRTLFNKRLEYQQSEQEIKRADDWLNQMYSFVHRQDQSPSLEWILDQAEVAVVRYGARVLLIDPWNRMESQRNRQEAEYEYILRCLKAMAQFAVDMNCHVQIIAHPAKMDANRKGGAPILEDIAGAKAWDTVPDQGFVIHRPKVFENGQRHTEACLYVRKARFEELGYPMDVMLNYDLSTRTYVGLTLPISSSAA